MAQMARELDEARGRMSWTKKTGLHTRHDGASAAERYGAVEMVELDEPVISTDGVECAYESEWIDETPVGADGYRGQPYRVRLLF